MGEIVPNRGMSANIKNVCKILGETEHVDPNLLLACCVGLAQKQHISVSCKKPATIMRSLQYVTRQVLGLDTLIVRCFSTMTWHQMSMEFQRSGAHESIPQVIVLENADKISAYLQSLLLETLTRKRIIINNEKYDMPEQFLVIFVVTDSHKGLTLQLRDYLLLEHSIDKEGYDYREPPSKHSLDLRITQQDLNEIVVLSEKVTIVSDITGYMQDLVLFLRNHRLVRGGVSPKTSRDFERLVRTVTALQGFEFATPSIVALVARKLFPIHVRICQPQDEPGLRYGGDLRLVKKWIKKWDEDLIIENVINSVPVPT